MNYTPEQIASIVLKVLKEIEAPGVSSLSYKQKIKILKDPNCPQEALELLATDDNPYVRQDVVRNPNTPQNLLELLATDEDPYVRQEVARNPNCSQKLLELLATDEDHWVRELVEKAQTARNTTLN